jgi:hypothetical protein
MKSLLAVFALAWASGASAQAMSWDYSHYPPFQALTEALAKGQRQEAMYVEDRSPAYVLQRFVIEGKSATDWTDALEVLNTMRKAEPKTPTGWYERFQKQGAQCPSNWTLIAQNKDSVTFQRDSLACSLQPAQTGLYRVLYGKQQVFTLIFTSKAPLSEEKRRQVLAMLDSATVR